jgi:bacteriophage N4 adsorption protein B
VGGLEQIVSGQLLPALLAIEHELLLFAAFWFIVGAIDEAALDLSYLWLRFTGRLREARVALGDEAAPLRGRAAVLVAAWQEADVIGAMIAHTLKAWPHAGMTLYVGCYANDPATLATAMKGAGGDRRVRIVVNDRPGPTTKADCLNRLYAALCRDEDRWGERYRSVVLHDAEDMVHPAALSLIDRTLAEVGFVQLPVRPEPQAASRWIAGHYGDEFAEAHAKSMVVRSKIGAAIPAAGVGCGFDRDLLTALARERSGRGSGDPFAAESLTEDYELGLLVSRSGASSRFLRVRDHLGELVATRAYFPGRLDEAVRQKARWLHGIAFQGWDRLGWFGGPLDVWMALRDRRGPLTALVLACAYLLVLIEGVLAIARFAGWQGTLEVSPLLGAMMAVSFAAFAWRTLWRFGFTAGEYGLTEGLRAVLRIPVANIIAIMAGRRALVAYARSLMGEVPGWDKTAHASHPAEPAREAAA